MCVFADVRGGRGQRGGLYSAGPRRRLASRAGHMLATRRPRVGRVAGQVSRREGAAAARTHIDGNFIKKKTQ